MHAMLADVVHHDALWFPDAACARQFATKGTAEKAKTRALAKCLVQQRPIATTRRSALAGGAVLTFAPGIEIEVLFRGDRVQWIGTSRLTAQSFEALRTAGSTQLDGVLAAKGAAPASAWVEVCFDKAGAVVRTAIVEAKPTTSATPFLTAIADWRFKAPLRGAPICALTHLTYPAANAPMTETLPPSSPPVPKTNVYDDLESPYDLDIQLKPFPRNVPPSLLEAQRIRGNAKISPDAATRAAMKRAGKSTVMASAKLCIDVAGRVDSIKMLKSSGFSDYDRKLEREMRRWGYRPYLVRNTATPVCTAVTFIFHP